MSQPIAPGAAWNWPVLHSRHACWPVSGWNWPAAQAGQADTPCALEAVPAGHARHVASGWSRYVPTSQAWHAMLPVCDSVPLAVTGTLPTVHCLQLARPGTSAYVATAQSLHCVALLPVWNEPMGQR